MQNLKGNTNSANSTLLFLWFVHSAYRSFPWFFTSTPVLKWQMINQLKGKSCLDLCSVSAVMLCLCITTTFFWECWHSELDTSSTCLLFKWGKRKLRRLGVTNLFAESNSNLDFGFVIRLTNSRLQYCHQYHMSKQ